MFVARPAAEIEHRRDQQLRRIRTGVERTWVGKRPTSAFDPLRKRRQKIFQGAKQHLEEANANVIEKNWMLEALSSKLSKYLSPQIYESIFKGAKQSRFLPSARS
jgi:hypothetical protein